MANQSKNETLSERALQEFANLFGGRLVRRGDPGYDEARKVWNGMIDRHPACIAYCQTEEDVIACIRFARQFALPLAVRGGGHNVAGHATCDDGLVIDLSPMKDIRVDPERRTASAGAGVLWGELDAATQPYGLATPGGLFSRTGIAGLTLGGGFGWLRGPFGLSCDNLIGARMVTADGRLVTASQGGENPDLLWGLRGGGGNFGVVTRFEFQLHPVGPEVMFGMVFHDARGDKLKTAIQQYRDFCASAPDEVSIIGFTGIFPPGAAHYPEEIQGLPYFAIFALYAGSPEIGKKLLQPLRDFATPLFDGSGVMPYVDVQKAFDEEYPDGLRYYWKSTNLTRLDDEIIDRIIEHARRQPSPYSTTDLWHIGGMVKKIEPDQSAFYGRQAAFLLNPEANWIDPADDEANLGWVREFVRAMQPYSDGSRYLNFAGFQEEGETMVRQAFGSQYKRLAELKKKFDPDNLFRLNQNIDPAA